MTVIIDYGVGNLFSLVCSFEKIGEKAVVTSDPALIGRADRILLPGVGAFCDAAEKLFSSGLVPVLKAQAEKGVPLLGICLGMQLLFEKSNEYGEHNGLGLLKGVIRPLSEIVPAGLKVPHMGWNALCIRKDHPLLKNVATGDCVYFVHSYHACDCEESVIATAEYGADITAAVACGNIMGCQFHPEKSGEAGLGILRAFCEMKAGAVC